MFPSIRQLPILGITYADLYRRTKIQETVYETLTQEYELAKVQEAKETPSVKVLDPANVPERKSFPPRLLIIALCTCFASAGGASWIITRTMWSRVESSDPRKMLARDVFQKFTATMPWSPPNGSRWQSVTHRAWTKMVRRQAASDHDPK